MIHRVNRDTTEQHKPATDVYNVDGVIVEASSHSGVRCQLHGVRCEHVDAVIQAIDTGKVPALEPWNRTIHWG